MPHAKQQHNNFIIFFVVIIVIVFLGSLLVAGLQNRTSPTGSIPQTLNYSPTGVIQRPQDLLKQSDESIDSPSAFSVGPKDAKVVFVEFLDYQCPYCQMEVPIVRQLMTAYKDASVRFVFREMPIVSIHPYAMNVAEGALCAKDQGNYLEYHDYAYLHQLDILEDSPPLFAKEVGLDMTQFNACYSQKLHHQQIVNDLYDAQSLGLTGTPTFFINDERIVGAAMYSELKSVIDTALRK